MCVCFGGVIQEYPCFKVYFLRSGLTYFWRPVDLFLGLNRGLIKIGLVIRPV